MTNDQNSAGWQNFRRSLRSQQVVGRSIWHRQVWLSLVTLGAIALSATVPCWAGGQEKTVRVISTGDGDTFRVEDQGERVTVRLACIDAPERKQTPFGPLAAARLQELLPVGAAVQLRVITRDRYGRTIAEVFYQGQPINLKLVQEGLAFVHPQYIHQCDRDRFMASETQAKQQQVGVWSQPGIIPPWEYRRNR